MLDATTRRMSSNRPVARSRVQQVNTVAQVGSTNRKLRGSSKICLLLVAYPENKISHDVNGHIHPSTSANPSCTIFCNGDKTVRPACVGTPEETEQ
jgi:hypothetical protein